MNFWVTILAVADRAVGQLANLDIVAAHQLCTELLLRYCRHPVHLKNIFHGTDETLRLAVTAETPFHLQ